MPCVAGDTANIVGVATADSNAVFNQLDTDAQGVFGQVQISATAGLMPFSPAFLLVNTVYGLLVEMSLSQSYSWVSQATGGPSPVATIGQRVGINVVGGTAHRHVQQQLELHYADPAQAACGNVGEALVFRPQIGVQHIRQSDGQAFASWSADTTATSNIGR